MIFFFFRPKNVRDWITARLRGAAAAAARAVAFVAVAVLGRYVNRASVADICVRFWRRLRARSAAVSGWVVGGRVGVHVSQGEALVTFVALAAVM